MLRVEETFTVGRSPEAVFDYLSDPARLVEWKTARRPGEPMTAGPLRAGTRIRERTKPPVGKEFEQVVEFAEFDPPRRFGTHIVEGPVKVDGLWTFTAEGDGTRVDFAAWGPLPGPLRLLAPVARRIFGRQFAQ